jgi:hypothetical protein
LNRDEDRDASTTIIITGLVPVIHVLSSLKKKQVVDGRVKPGHDELRLHRRSGQSLAQGPRLRGDDAERLRNCLLHHFVMGTQIPAL